MNYAKEGLERESNGSYLYLGGKYRIRNLGYWPPDGRNAWEAVELETGEGVAHGHTLRECLDELKSSLFPNSVNERPGFALMGNVVRR